MEGVRMCVCIRHFFVTKMELSKVIKKIVNFNIFFITIVTFLTERNEKYCFKKNYYIITNKKKEKMKDTL